MVCVSECDLKKRPLENGCSELKYKPLRVCCIRDYPPGCGRNARQRNLGEKGNVVALIGDKENLVDDERRTSVVVDDSVKLESNAVVKTRLLSEMVEPLGGLAGEVVDMSVVVSKEEKILTNMEVLGLGSGEDLKSFAQELEKEMLEDAYQGEMKREDAPENGIVLVSSSQKLSPQKWSIGDANVLVIRDYPLFCGRHVPCPIEEERGRVVRRKRSFGGTERAGAKRMPKRETVGASVVESKSNAGHGNAQESELRSELSNGSRALIKKGSKNVRILFRKVPKEILVHSHDKSPKQRGFGCGVDRGIGQGLMPSPSSLLKQWNGASETSPGGVRSRSKRKKRDFTGLEKSRIDFGKHKSEADYSGGNSSKGKSVFAREKTYGGIGGVPVWDEEDSVVHDDEHHKDSGTDDFAVRLPRRYGASCSNSSDARIKVRETLYFFQTIIRMILQRNEGKLGRSKRIDFRAVDIVKEKGKELNIGKQFLGAIPGVEVGDEYQYRVELALVGVHHLYQPGIDYMDYDGQIIAISIVASGGYDDDLDNADVLIYSGQGGNPAGPCKKPEDQKLVRGNLSLKNSISVKNPVRVIRGSRETKASDSSDGRAKIVMTYTYDGLYIVKRYWQEPGPHGKLVYKFELTRIPGQPEIAWKEVKKLKKHKIRKGLSLDDISGGKELLPICAVNLIDNDIPPPFTYMTMRMYPDWYRPISPKGCDCTDGCLDPEKCSCAVKNGGKIPYNHNGAIVEAKSLVYECGPSCKCPPSCCNRVSQHGIKIQLEIFKTDSKGWGVRSLNSIPSGSFICEYTGELLDDKEAEQKTGYDEYLFDIGRCSLSDDIQTLQPDAQSSFNEVEEVQEDVGYTIDAAQCGNVGRFINHSCSPNLYAQDVLYDHDDKRMAHIMLFAAANIPPLQELCYHYNYPVDQIRDSNGNIKSKMCYCGSTVCSGRMY